MQIQNKNSFIIKSVTIALCALTIFYIGSYVGGKSVVEGQAAAGKLSIKTITPTPVSISGMPVSDAQLAPLWKAWKILDSKFVDHDATSTPEKRVYGAIKGLAQSYGDPYTVFFDPQEAQDFKNDVTGSFEGVGMEIGLGKEGTPNSGAIVVVAPLKGSPAEQAGMLTGDLIVKINENSTAGYTVEKAVKQIRGPKGTKVKLTVLREGVAEPFVVEITRAIIDMPTIDIETNDKNGKTHVAMQGEDSGSYSSNDVKIIKLYSFNAQAPEKFRSAVRDFIKSGQNKLILDLRGNPGGYLDAAVYMASFFLPAGDVIVSEDFGGSKPTAIHRSAGYNVFSKDLKMLILVNGGSASASEILAGALKDHGVAKLVGTKTFGKGSVQEVIPITADTALKVTVAHWLTPNGNNISKQGIEPDYVVKPEPANPNSAPSADVKDTAKSRSKTSDDKDVKVDVQLERALEIIRKEM